MTADTDALAPNLERLQSNLDELSQFVDSSSPGWTRRVYSDPYKASREWTKNQMAQAGLDVTEDAAGNLIGRMKGLGSEKKAGALVTGSHTDTVHGGGRFDGIAGVIGALEVARRFQETNTRLNHDFWVVDFLGEEPNPHGVSCIGSRAAAGLLPVDYLDLRREDGQRLGDVMQQFGTDPNAALNIAWSPSDIAAFVELHVEQGPVLERKGLSLGVVTAIAGIRRAVARFAGRADHAGTMPMTERKDALAAAAEAVLKIEQIGCSGDETVATVGRLESEPGSLNVVPSSAAVWAEMRSVSPEWLGSAEQRLAADITELARMRGIDVDFEWLNDQDPVPATETIQDIIANSAQSLGYEWTSIPSGAGHDAAHMAHLAPMGMLFVPSRGGRSHCPEEWTDVEALGIGVHTLATTLLQLDVA